MSTVEACSVPWFVMYMRLHNWGLTPTLTPIECMPSKQELAEFWGPPSGRGYTFTNHGMPEYGEYVVELHRRVMQRPWPTGGVLSFHFSRGLLAEAMGEQVNWAEFAYRSTHPHQSHSIVPRILPQYESLTEPLPELKVVRPRANISRMPPAAPHFTQSEDLDDVPAPLSQACNTSDSPQENPAPRIHTAAVDQVLAEEVVDFAADQKQTRKDITSAGLNGEGTSRGEAQGPDKKTVDGAALSALMHLRGSLTGTVEHERFRLQNVVASAGKTVANVRKHLAAEREKLKFIERKVREKSDAHDRAAASFRRARDVMDAVVWDDGAQSTTEEKKAMKKFIKLCDKLVVSWLDNAAQAHSRLQAWEFKQKRQTERVEKVTEDLTYALGIFREKRTEVETTLGQLKSLTEVLGIQ